jgi:NADH-quinone oxidoreductase subunit L
MIDLIPLVIALPALGAIINCFYPRKAVARIVGPAVVGLAFLVALVVLMGLLNLPTNHREHDVVLWMWMPGSQLDVSVALRVDPLSLAMTLVVTGVGFLIHIYSIGYMAHDAKFARFFFYLNLFIVAMLILVLANNYVLMFLGWEGVGLCSYLLIGFWFYKPEAANAAKKAFVVNRIGDFAFTLGVLWLFNIFGTADFHQIFEEAPKLFTPDHPIINWITLLLFIGATGKSAQLPLYVWLPDAMEGPTPVSALIHAATMVTAGVYMVARSHVLFELAHATSFIVATIGVATAFFAATIALVNQDFKRVLAYSTISQLGYMFLAVGVGAYVAAIFHLITHAFFKALMFLGAGSVMHGMNNETNVLKMGGLRKYMPYTAWTFVIGWLAIAGIPPFAGFFSKDDILAETFLNGYIAHWVLGLLTAALTAFYVSRITFLAFFGKRRFDHHTLHPHESPATMTVPLMVLALLSLIGGALLRVQVSEGVTFVGENSVIGDFLAPVFEGGHHAAAPLDLNLTLTLIGASVGAGVIGIFSAYVIYIARWIPAAFLTKIFKPIYALLYHQYFVDEIYRVLFVWPAVGLAELSFKVIDRAVIDGALVNGAAWLMRLWSRSLGWLQGGYVRGYAFLTLLGAALLVIFFLFRL